MFWPRREGAMLYLIITPVNTVLLILYCAVNTQVSNGTFNDHRNFFEGLFLRVFLEIIFQFHILGILVI
jgi:hypothetical protein